jgi:hypothetical protein
MSFLVCFHSLKSFAASAFILLRAALSSSLRHAGADTIDLKEFIGCTAAFVDDDDDDSAHNDDMVGVVGIAAGAAAVDDTSLSVIIKSKVMRSGSILNAGGAASAAS